MSQEKRCELPSTSKDSQLETRVINSLEKCVDSANPVPSADESLLHEPEESTRGKKIEIGNPYEDSSEMMSTQAKSQEVKTVTTEIPEKKARYVQKKVGFTFSIDGVKNGKKIAFSGASEDPLINALQRSSFFSKEHKVSKKKDILIHATNILKAWVKGSLPCGVIPGKEHFDITFLNQKIDQGDERHPYPVAETVLFYIKPKGKTESHNGQRIIVSCDHINSSDVRLCVSSHKTQTVLEALEADGRFTKKHFSNLFWLENLEGTKYEHGSDVDVLSNLEEYTMIVSKAKLNEKILEKQIDKAPVKQEAAQCEEPCQNDKVFTKDSFRKIELQQLHGTKVLCKTFGKLFDKFCQQNDGNEAAWKILKEQYRLCAKEAMFVTTYRMAIECSQSVGLGLCCNGKELIPIGSCFVLQGDLILTCYHVIKDILTSFFAKKLKICVAFDYETNTSAKQIPVDEIVISSKKFDYAILRLIVNLSPLGLIGSLSSCPIEDKNKGIIIIGHPDGKPKKIDVGSVIPFSYRKGKVQEGSCNSFIHVTTSYSFDEISDHQVLTYDSCFYHGSSGSPVLDISGNLIAMHTGGYTVENREAKQKQSLIEYGRSMYEIICDAAKRSPEVKKIASEILKQIRGGLDVANMSADCRALEDACTDEEQPMDEN